jgi:lipoprotein-anchoring transpeptidase ErfK/SrfK
MLAPVSAAIRGPGWPDPMNRVDRTLKTFSRFAFANTLVGRVGASVSAIAFAVLLWQPMLSCATPPTASEAIELHADLGDEWVDENRSTFLADSIGRSFRLLTDVRGFDVFDDMEDTADQSSAWRKQDREHATIAIPQLEGSFERMLEPDASVTLRFDKPVGKVQVASQVQFTVNADRSHRVFRLVARNYAQGQTYPVKVIWRAATGEPYPPLNLQVTTPPPLSVAVNTEGLANLGLLLPLRLTFSEPLMEREKILQQVAVKTGAGQDVQGTWRWTGQRSLQFTPRPTWPPSSVIQVSVDATGLRTLQGGWMDHPILSSFTTGTDRRIFVYLDTQRVTAVENGQVVQTFRVSTGKEKTPTAEGNFYIYDRYLHRTMRSRGVRKGQPGYYLIEDVPYTQFFNGDMALHGAFWHNSFGRPASHGCVNMSTREMNKRWPNVAENAGWLYSWASLGVPVTVLKDNPEKMMLSKARN